MSQANIIEEINETYSEYLEMMSTEEKFVLITNVLLQKLSQETIWKEHYKSCWNASLKQTTCNRINL
jgi:hypothetical protein